MTHYKVNIYIGTEYDKDGNKLSKPRLVSNSIAMAKHKLASLYGGCTSYEGASGNYVMDNGTLASEACIVLETIVAEIQHTELKSICNDLKIRLNQESILLTISPLIYSEFI